MSENEDKCAVCGIQSKQFCSACKLVRYCGEEHQKQHWKQHKSLCKPFCLSTVEDVGRFLLATRDIKANTIIFTEMPLIIGPKWFLNEREQQIPIVPCVGCYTPVKVGENCCPRCHWPACSEHCPGLTNSKLHGLECPLLMLGSGPVDNDLKSVMDYYRTDTIVVLKSLALQLYPKKWQQLMSMQSHEDERINSELYEDAENRIVSYLKNQYLNRLKSLETEAKKKILANYDSTLLHKICGIIETNYMCINISSGLELTSLYHTACMMEHSCLPNCYFTFDENNGFRISVTAGRDIKKGEHLQIMYSNMLWGTQMRQDHLQLTKHFICSCERCCDKTELGTYLSGIKCMGTDTKTHCDGIQLPENPLNRKTDWSCDKCEVKINNEELQFILLQMNDEVENLLSKKPTIKQLETLIDKLSNFLHENHYHLFNLKHSLMQLYGNEDGSMLQQLSDDMLMKKISMAENLLHICDKLDPYTIRLSLYIAIILNEMHTALVEYGKRRLPMAKTSMDKKIALNNFEKARDLLNRAENVLQKELDTNRGWKLNESIKKSILNINELIAQNTAK